MPAWTPTAETWCSATTIIRICASTIRFSEVKVSADIQAKLANHEVVFIPGMKVGGKTISTDLRYSDTGRPLFGNNARNYRSRLGEENPRPRQRVRRRLPSLPGAQPKGMKIG